MKAYKILGAIIAFSIVFLPSAFAQSPQTGPVHLQAELLPSQTLPIQVTGARLENFDTGSNLEIDLAQKGNVPVSKLLVNVYISHNGSMRSGEGIPIDLADVAPGRSFPLSLTLDSRAHLVPGDTALVFVSRVHGSAGTEEVPRTGRIPLLKEFMQGQFSGNFSAMLGTGNGIRAMNAAGMKPTSLAGISGHGGDEAQPNIVNCDARLQEAKATCAGGVHSFSCNPQTGQFSFTCN